MCAAGVVDAALEQGNVAPGALAEAALAGRPVTLALHQAKLPFHLFRHVLEVQAQPRENGLVVLDSCTGTKGKRALCRT